MISWLRKFVHKAQPAVRECYEREHVIQYEQDEREEELRRRMDALADYARSLRDSETEK